MKNLKKILLLVFCLALAMSIALVSCEKPETPPEHTHTWSEWVVTTPADCGETGVETRVCTTCAEPETRNFTAKHEGTIVCENCGEPTISYDALDFSAHKSFGLKLTDIEAVINNDNHIEESATLVLENSEFYVGLNDNDELVGYGTATLKTTFKNIPSLVTEANVLLFIEDGMVYIGVDGATPMSSEIESNDMAIAINIEKIPALVKAQELLEQTDGAVDGYATALEEFFEETLAPIFANVDLEDAANAINAASIKYSAAIANALFVATDNDDGTTTLTYSLEAMKGWFETAVTSKITALIDLVAGEGTAAALEAALTDEKLYNYSVAELITYIEEEQGVDLEALLAALDELAAILWNREEATLEEALSFILTPEGAEAPVVIPDLDTFLTDETILAYDVKFALSMIPGLDNPETEEDETVASVTAMIAQAFDYMEEKTIVDIITDMMSQNSPDGGNSGMIAPAAETENDPTAVMIASFNDTIDMIAELISYEITVDANGNATAINISLNMSELPDLDAVGMIHAIVMAGYDFDIEITAEKITFSYDMTINEIDMSQSCTMELIPGYTITPDSAKLEAIKAKVNAIKDKATLTAIVNKYATYSDVKVIDDSANNRFFIVDLNVSFNSYNGSLEFADGCYAEIRCINYADLGGYMHLASKGCGKNVLIDISIAAELAELKLNDSSWINPDATYEQVMAALWAQFTPDYIDTVCEGGWSVDDYVFTALYNTESGAYDYDTYSSEYDDRIEEYGHVFVKQDTSTEGDDCTTIYRTDYKCSCGETYVDYWTNGHDMTVNGADYDGEDGFDLSYGCANCDDVEAQAVGSIIINTSEDITIDTTPDKDADYGETALFAFSWTATSTGCSIVLEDEYLDRVLLTVYKKNGDDDYTYYTNQMVYANASSGGFNYLTEGTEYYIILAIDMSGYYVEEMLDEGGEFEAILNFSAK